MSFDPDSYNLLIAEKEILEKQLELIQKEIQSLQRSIRVNNFEYTNPAPNFDRSKVKGLVANLISIPTEHHDKAEALEVCAGGKLYQVVVDTQEVAAQLIQNGKMRNRTTFLPLNKIKSFKASAEVAINFS